MKLEKDITFIYMDSSEKAMYMPIYNEAKKRGYRVKLTTNMFEKCEIGFYCQHVNLPQFSKFSIIMLHDIIQQYGNWPDIWLREPWDKYDIGILPSNQWVENWKQCAKWFYARPRLGVYHVGWPKADTINEIQNKTYKEAFMEEYGLDPHKKTVLYAPAWENDHKQDDFVQAMLPLDVNIIIKQYDANPKEFPEFAKNIQEMYLLHKDIPNVTILPPTTNIFYVIAVSDILVSEESSTMAEATMMGVPAISVSNWLIPDVIPSRYPECNYEFVTMTTKEKLSECVKEMLENYDYYKVKTLEASKNNFSNIGKTSAIIMDILDDYIDGKPCRYDAIPCDLKKRLPFKQYLRHKKVRVYREVYSNYRVRYGCVDFIWKGLRKVKRLIK